MLTFVCDGHQFCEISRKSLSRTHAAPVARKSSMRKHNNWLHHVIAAPVPVITKSKPKSTSWVKKALVAAGTAALAVVPSALQQAGLMRKAQQPVDETLDLKPTAQPHGFPKVPPADQSFSPDFSSSLTQPRDGLTDEDPSIHFMMENRPYHFEPATHLLLPSDAPKALQHIAQQLPNLREHSFQKAQNKLQPDRLAVPAEPLSNSDYQAVDHLFQNVAKQLNINVPWGQLDGVYKMNKLARDGDYIRGLSESPTATVPVPAQKSRVGDHSFHHDQQMRNSMRNVRENSPSSLGHLHALVRKLSEFMSPGELLDRTVEITIVWTDEGYITPLPTDNMQIKQSDDKRMVTVFVGEQEHGLPLSTTSRTVMRLEFFGVLLPEPFTMIWNRWNVLPPQLDYSTLKEKRKSEDRHLSLTNSFENDFHRYRTALEKKRFKTDRSIQRLNKLGQATTTKHDLTKTEAFEHRDSLLKLLRHSDLSEQEAGLVQYADSMESLQNLHAIRTQLLDKASLTKGDTIESAFEERRLQWVQTYIDVS